MENTEINPFLKNGGKESVVNVIVKGKEKREKRMENNGYGYCEKCGGELEYFYGPGKKVEEINFSYGRLVCQSCENEIMVPCY